MTVSAHSLSGRTVLVPVTPDRRELAQHVASLGATVVPVEFIAIAPTPPERLASVVRAWIAGDYDWLAVTSRNAVVALDAAARSLGVTLGVSLGMTLGDASTATATAGAARAAATATVPRVAAVGAATAAVCQEVGLRVDLVPHQADARGLVALMPSGPGRVLAPLGNLASPILMRGLERKGWMVDTVEAYRTVDGAGLSAQVTAAVESGQVDAVVLTSGSVATRLATAVTHVPGVIVAIGATTAAAARAAGLTVSATASEPTYAGLCDALAQALDLPPTASLPPTLDTPMRTATQEE